MRYVKTFEEFDILNLFKGKEKVVATALNYDNDTIYLSNNLINTLKNVGNNNICSLFFTLKMIEEDKLIPNHANYLDVDGKGNVSYLDGKYLLEETEFNPEGFTNPKRQNIKVTKVFTKILKPEYLPTDQRDIESFINSWKGIFENELRVEEFTGEDILRAYNYKNEMPSSYGSCAVFTKGSSHVKKEMFDILTKNPETFSAFVVFRGDKIIARQIGIKGIQTKTHGELKEGEYYKILNNYYGEGGTKSKAGMMILKYAKNCGYKYINYGNLYEIDSDYKKMASKDSIFRVHANTRQKSTYPAFDGCYVNFHTNEIATRIPKENGNGKWQGMYHARCPVFL
jgi:hypothetical protein